MWGCEDVDLQMWGCEDVDLQVWGCEDVDLQMWGCEDVDLWRCEDVDLQMWGCEDVDLQMWGCEDVDLQVWGCEDLDLQMWGCEDVDLQMWGCEDVDLQVWGCEDLDLQVWGCEDVDQQVWRCEDLDLQVWGCEDLDLQMWGCEDLDQQVWRCDVRVWRCRSADVRVWRCRSADVRVWRCSITAAFLRRTLRRRSREKVFGVSGPWVAGRRDLHDRKFLSVVGIGKNLEANLMYQPFIESAMMRRNNMMMSRSWKWSPGLRSRCSWVHPQVGRGILRCRRWWCQSGSRRSSSRLRWVLWHRRRRCIWGSCSGSRPRKASSVSVTFVLHRRGNRKNGGERWNEWVWVKNTSSTAQGGGGSFKNRKPIGEVGCCESGIAERIHWWTERCLKSPTLALSFSDYLPTYLSIFYVSNLSIDLYRSTLSLSLSSNYLSIYLSIHPSIYLSICGV